MRYFEKKTTSYYNSTKSEVVLCVFWRLLAIFFKAHSFSVCNHLGGGDYFEKNININIPRTKYFVYFGG